MTEEEYDRWWLHSVVLRRRKCKKHNRIKDRLTLGEDVHEKYGLYTYSLHGCRYCLEEKGMEWAIK